MTSLADMSLKSRNSFAKLVGKKLRQGRLSKGISLKHFEALENSIDRHALSKIEQGKKVPNLYTIYRIAHALNVSLDDIFQDIK